MHGVCLPLLRVSCPSGAVLPLVLIMINIVYVPDFSYNILPHLEACGLSDLLHPGDSTFVCVAETCRSRFHTDGCSSCIEREPFGICNGIEQCQTPVNLTTITFLWTAMHRQANHFSLACVLAFGLVCFSCGNSGSSGGLQNGFSGDFSMYC